MEQRTVSEQPTTYRCGVNEHYRRIEMGCGARMPNPDAVKRAIVPFFFCTRKAGHEKITPEEEKRLTKEEIAERKLHHAHNKFGKCYHRWL